MRTPTLTDVIANLRQNQNSLEVTDVSFGDPANTNVTIPVVTAFSAVVTYYSSPITQTPLAKITWSWSEPLMYDENNNVISSTDHGVQDDVNFDPVVDYMFGCGGAPVAYSSSQGSTSVVTQGHILGANVTGYVYAVLKSGIKGPVANYTAAVSKDTTAPAAPSDPILTSSASVVTVTYDGKVAGGGAQPSDYRYTEIIAGPTNPPTTKVGEFNGPGSYSFGADPSLPIYVRLYSYDQSMNKSASSAIVTTDVKSVLDDTGLNAALSNKASIYAQNSDPTLTNTVTDGSWWFVTDPVDTSVIITIKKRVSGAWVTDTMHASTVLAAQSIVSGNISSGAIIADNIKAGELYTKLATTGELKADAINTGIMNAIITISGMFQTASSGKRVVISNTGITLYGLAADGITEIPLIVIGTDGEAFFSGNVTALTLKVLGSMTLLSSSNSMEPGSILTLRAGIQSPGNPPTVTNYYDSIQLMGADGLPVNRIDMATRDSDGFWYSATTTVPASATQYIIKHNSDGTYNSTITVNVNDFETRTYLSDITCIGTNLYALYAVNILETSSYEFYIYKINSDSSFVQYLGSRVLSESLNTHERYITDSEAGFNIYAYAFRLANNGTNPIIAYVDKTSGKESFSVYSSPTGGYVTYTNTTKWSGVGQHDLWTVAAGNFDYGVAFYVTSIAGTGTTRHTKASDSSNQTNYEWPTPVSTIIAIEWDGTYFCSVDQNGIVYKHSSIYWTDVAAQTKNYDAGFTFYNPAPYQSKLSPKSTIAVKKRARVKMSVSDWQIDPSITQLKFYMGSASSTLYSQGANSNGFINLASIATSGDTPPASTTFPTAVAAKITNDNASLVISADGTVKLPPDKFRGYPIKWVGKLDSAKTLTANNYTSIPTPTVLGSTGEWSPTWVSDCMVIGLHCWVRIVWTPGFQNTSSGGTKVASILKNATAHTFNASSLGTNVLSSTMRQAASGGSSTTLQLIWEGEVLATDHIMLMALSSTADKMDITDYRSNVSVTIERMLD